MTRALALTIAASLMFGGALVASAGCPNGKCGMGKAEMKGDCGAKKECASDKQECKTQKECNYEQKKAEHKMVEISTDTLKVLLSSGSEVTVLDARTGKYDDGNRIPGAKSLASDTDNSGAEALIPSKDSLIVTYCSNLQCPASRMLAKRLGELGYKNILEYPEGIAGWIEAGNEVEKAK